MDILKTAIRRILVRNTDKAISTSGRNILIELSEYSPSLPTVKRLIANVILFALINFLLIKFFILIGLPGLALITPLFFITTIITPLFRKHIFGRQQTAIAVADRRYKTGTRTVGYKFIKDKANKIDYTQSEIKLSRIEGLIKVLLFISLTLMTLHSMNSSEYKVKQLNTGDIPRLLKPNDTLMAKLVFSSTVVYIKVKEKLGHSKDYDYISFQEVYNDTAKQLGYFAKLDSIKRYDKFELYFAYNPFHKKDTTFTLSDKQKRFDTLFYIKSDDGTITSSNLPK